MSSTWAEWLLGQFAAHPTIRRPVDLVRAAGTKSNGRPVVDSPRVTDWLKRDQRPTYDLVRAVAAAFERPEAEALRAAGYPVDDVGGGALPEPRPVRAEAAVMLDDELDDDGRAHLANQIKLLKERKRLMDQLTRASVPDIGDGGVPLVSPDAAPVEKPWEQTSRPRRPAR